MDLLDQMATYVDIVDAGSLSAAARRKRLSLAAVSRQLGALEKDLGAALILRTTRALKVTDAGRVFYEHALRTLREIEAARANVRGTVSGTLRVSAAFTVGLELLLDALPAIAEAHPALSIDLRLEDHASDLLRDGVDVAIRAGIAPPDSTSIIARELARFTRWAVASSRYLRAHATPKSVASLAKHAALVQLTNAGPLDAWTLGDETVRVQGPLRCTSPTAIRALALAGQGIALLPDWLVRDDIAAGRLKRVLAEHATPLVQLWALHRIELRDAPRVRVFLDHVTRAFAYHRRS
jgi:DNA-binding transcriptional LysR family regulator